MLILSKGGVEVFCALRTHGITNSMTLNVFETRVRAFSAIFLRVFIRSVCVCVCYRFNFDILHVQSTFLLHFQSNIL